MASNTTVPKLYRSVVEDVITNVREAFLDDGVDEQVLQELKQLWDAKLLQSKAVDGAHPEQDRLYQAIQQQQQQQQQLQQQQQQQQQRSQQHATAQSIAVSATSNQKSIVAQTVTVTQPSPIPIFNPAQGTIELSAAAQQASGALPLALYQQQLAALQSGTITLQTGQGGAQIIVAPQGVLQQVQQGAATIAVAAPTGQMAATSQVVTAGQAHAQLAAVTTSAQARATTVTTAQGDVKGVIQIDGANDSSSDDDYDKDDDDDDDDENEDNDENNDLGEEEEPLNTDDDVSDQEPSELFDTDNVVVCQYDKINRNKNKWKFHLKDGIMNLKGKDYVFQKASGEAEW